MSTLLFTKTMPHPEYAHLVVVFEAREENERPDNHFDDQRDIDLAYRGGSNWFSATVKVKIEGTSVIGVDHMGCCSWASFEDFVADQYFADMIDEATNDLISDLNETVELINGFVSEYSKVG